MKKKIALVVGLLLVCAVVIVSVAVEVEAGFDHEQLEGRGPAKALILYHPSRDARFSDDLSLALAEGMKAEGFAVERATLTAQTPAEPRGYALIAVVSNTYDWTPDLPTLRYLGRAKLNGIPALGLIGGAGSTGRSQAMLDAALRKTGANAIAVRSVWLWRPNDKRRMDEPNRCVALDMARKLGSDSGRFVLAMMPKSQ